MCYYNTKGKHGKGQNKGYQQQPNYQQQGKAINNNSLPINRNATINQHHNLHNTTKSTAKVMENNGAVVPFQQINDSDHNYYNYEEDPSSYNYSYNQDWFPEADYPQQLPGQKVDQRPVQQQQQQNSIQFNLLGPLTMGTLYEIDAIIHIGRQAPRNELQVNIQSFADSDWAGCNTTRKNASGAITLAGEHTSQMQKLSSTQWDRQK
eukprot:4714503-Amphidinium_carterae.1